MRDEKDYFFILFCIQVDMWKVFDSPLSQNKSDRFMLLVLEGAEDSSHILDTPVNRSFKWGFF